MTAREPENEGQIFRDKDGTPYEGQRFILTDAPDIPALIKTDVVYYKGGKLHGSPAIQYFDGLEEIWEEGKFVGILTPPYDER